ncbi:MAG TPA: dynamin family protein [Cellulomonas sp.]|uniref:dynamin family protein n=1 Tax=Cellulomonas sp. TaxID=40001 RepID=UPI002E303C22|nr:dynamin family protein [Cellulomonas sp.]HEX5333989.1 dynamin family protein [Cellulomonas sp.]
MSEQAGTSVADGVLARPLAAMSLLDAVRDLRRDVERTGFPLEIASVEAARASRARLVDQLADHLVPRLEELSAPAIVVVAGSTGAGKSTIVNSLLGTEVTAAGVLRPTTRRPVLVHHPDDADLLDKHPVLEAVEVVEHTRVPRGIALLDAPDLDSVLDSNRATAHRLLEAADLWLFVTTAARYGDALPWQVLQGAVGRGASIAMVLNRVAPASLPTVRGDLLERLRGHGMQGAPLFVVPDVGPHEGLLDPAILAPITRWLQMLAGLDRARTVIGRTLRGSLAALRPWVDELAEAVQAQADAAVVLAAELDVAAQGPEQAARAAVHGGVVADGAARARWAELAAAGGPLATVVRSSGRVDRSRRAGRARAEALAPLVDALTRSAAANLTAAGARAELVLRTHLRGAGAPDGGPSLDAAWSEPEDATARSASAESSARAWVGSAAAVATEALRRAALEPSHEAVRNRGRHAVRAAKRAAKRAERAERALGLPGLAAVALAAAAGLEPARALLADLLGTAGTWASDELRADLADRGAAEVARERAAVGELLDDPDLASDASSLLRLRLAVLKGLT